MTPVRNNRPSTRLRRSPTPFFLQPQTVDALAALSSPGIERLVIYCGAGTTIDRTGLGWKELIDQAFPPVEEQDSDLPTANDIRFLHRHFQPPEVASILSQYVAERHGGYYKPGYRDEIAKNLVPALYFEKRVAPGQAWGRFMAGRLGGNISRLAILAASLGKSVIVATTNFDDLLEKNITERISLDYQARLNEDPRAEPVESTWLDADDPISSAELAPGTIALVYLHGRVPRDGSPSSRVVLTERDYADTRKRTVGRLSEILSMPRTGFLTVGASLTDPPLIEALARTPVPDDSCRYALVTRRSMGIDQAKPKRSQALAGHAARRCESIGINLLAPDFNVQAAQFCQELLIAMQSPGAYDSYSHRVHRWWTTWADLANQNGRDELVYEKLRDGLVAFQGKVFKSDHRRVDQREHFRLELWVRDDPASEIGRQAAADTRRLQRVATSTGPNFHHDCDPTVPIALATSSPAVRAMTEGRPLHLPAPGSDPAADEPGDGQVDEGDAAMWKSYMALPIWTPRYWVPIGVMVVASTANIKESQLQRISPDRTTEAIWDLVALARDILDPR